MKGKYEYLKDQYPEKISLEQLWKILRVAKRSAAYLVEHNIIPAHDTGRRTWRYEIQITDVIHYLRRREQFGSMIPPGAVFPHARKRREERKNMIRILENRGIDEVRKFFEKVLREYPDVMTAVEASEACGLDCPERVVLPDPRLDHCHPDV